MPSKIMEKIVLGVTEKQLKDNAVIGQHGFMSGKSCSINFYDKYPSGQHGQHTAGEKICRVCLQMMLNWEQMRSLGLKRGPHGSLQLLTESGGAALRSALWRAWMSQQQAC